ncbi:hypothetical protein WMF38_31385 [Sorangium sp. So ce118]
MTQGPGEAVGNLVHDARHYFQFWQAYQSDVLGVTSGLHPMTPTWRSNLTVGVDLASIPVRDRAAYLRGAPFVELDPAALDALDALDAGSGGPR